MRRRAPLLVFVCTALLAAPALAQCVLTKTTNVSTDATPPAITLAVPKTALGALSSDKVDLAVSLDVTATKDLTVRGLTLTDLRLNGAPIYAAPLTNKFQLPAGKTVSLPTPLVISIYFRDLDSLKPLQQAVTDGTARLEGTAYIDIEVNPLAQLVLMAKHPRIAVRFSQDAPISVPGGDMGKSIAIKTIAAADTALQTVSAGIQTGLNRYSQQRKALMANYAPLVYRVTTHYGVTDKQGGEYEYDCQGIGYQIAPTQVVVPKALVMPWRFDPNVAAELSADDAKPDMTLYGIALLPPTTGGKTLTLAQQDFKVGYSPDDDTQKVITPLRGKAKKISLPKSDSGSNLVILELASSIPLPDTAKPLTSLAGDDWPDLALFHFPDDPNATTPQLIFVPGKRDSARIHLGLSVDSHVWGSPLIAADGVVGLIQTEDSAASWADVIKQLKLQAVNP